MTAQNRTTNKAKFENGDTPQGSDYADLIDSYVSIADTSAQTMQSTLQVPEMIATTVSAGTVNATAATFAAGVTVSGAVTAGSVTTSVMTVIGTASVDTVFGQTANFATVSAGTVSIDTALQVSSTLTVATANGSGGSLTVPTTAVGYLVVSVSGVNRAIPFYATV